MYSKYLSLFVVLVLAPFCLTASGVSAQTAARCGPQPSSLTCNATAECEGIIRKAFSPGCKRQNGKPYFDGGCQCRGYCGYKCAAGCQADPECRWNKSKKKCFNIATGKPGQPLKICAATNSPTIVTSMPSSAPTSSPTRKATKTPTREPTMAPTTKGYCSNDAKFPGRKIETEFAKTLAMSPNGNIVLYSEVAWTKEPVTTVWITTRDPDNNGKWIPKQVGKYVNVSSVEGAAMSDNGEHLAFILYPYRPTVPQAEPSDIKLVFVKLNGKGKYKTQKSFFFEETSAVSASSWMSSKGDSAIVSYSALSDKLSYMTKTYVRENDKWREDQAQEGLILDSFSRDGRTALRIVNILTQQQQRFRRVYVRKNKEWVLEASDLVGSGTPLPKFQGTATSRFSADGNTLVIGTAEGATGNSGAFVFARTNGNWTQLAKVGGGNTREGGSTGISDDLNTIMLTDGFEEDDGGFKIFQKNGTTWTQAGATTLTFAEGAMLSANGNRVVTISPPSVWKC